ncbi:MAG: sulfatase-like hydrolase/transferase, partial [Alphaproteobacteria bacterium]
MKRPSVAAALRSVAVSLICAVALRACRTGAAPDQVDTVVLLSIDSLRADHVGALGYERATTPSIDALAERGVV